ncbi:hypothetical protein [Arenimonas composti]|uniref:Pilus formation protein N-terminal domain-containing protein n=1 Tax=Arenimonas composti TR7-09 = DSM 18010 TaxID=1121013 RepID=A0A091BL27_9GAMM|nr:hypothetical protein [Arenimonas composti]KFN51499.1 hypothetical protein P873_00130 [Arenimonas composti TR7-09 = DSM 18010]
MIDQSRRRHATGFAGLVAALALVAGNALATAPVPAAAAEPAPAVAPAPAAAPTPAQSTRVAVGDEIPFEALVNHIGATVRVSTNIHTEREGVITGASTMAINLEVAVGTRTISLAMPRERVVRVVLLADAPAKP